MIMAEWGYSKNKDQAYQKNSPGIHSTMIGTPISSSIPTAPTKEPNSVISYVNRQFDEFKEQKRINVANKESSKAEKQQRAKTIQEKYNKIEKMKQDIKKLQSGNLTASERAELIDDIIVSNKGSLPKGIEEKLEKQKEVYTQPIFPQGKSQKDQAEVQKIEHIQRTGHSTIPESKWNNMSKKQQKNFITLYGNPEILHEVPTMEAPPTEPIRIAEEPKKDSKFDQDLEIASILAEHG